MKGKYLHFAAGLVIGATLFGGGTALAAGILAEPSDHRIFVDGRQVQMEAYAINGNNYVKLRDIGQAVGFNVWWDSVSNCVRVDSAAPYTGAAPAQATAATGGETVIPQSDAQFVYTEGMVIRCDDGSTYTITDLSLYAKTRDMGPLPTPTCDWSQHPALIDPAVAVNHFGPEVTGDKDMLSVLNLYETRRMQYTLYNAFGKEPSLWANGVLRTNDYGVPLAMVQLGIEGETGIRNWWPWNESQITAQVASVPIARYQIAAWDVFYDGKFSHTEYMMKTT